jgi:CxxC motif-containing protein (DUF1111 family)
MRKPQLLWIAAGAALLAATPLTAMFAGSGGAGSGGGDIPGTGEPGGPDREFTAAERLTWLAGRQLFDHDFHRSDGLGSPEFNADSCRACHMDPVMGGAGPLELNVSRFGRDHGGQGPFEDLPGGQGLSKLRPPYVDGREEYDTALADCFEQRQTPSLFGGGLQDSVLESAILANEDPNDLDGDGIYGVARRVDINGVLEIGRFGWKAQIPRMADFTQDALAGECGVTTPDDGRGFGLFSDSDGTPDPEMQQAQVDQLSFFIEHIAAPQRDGAAGSLGARVAEGEQLFDTIGCAKCHVPEMDGANGPVPLYSNLLLHNVLPADFRGMEEPGAPSGYYKTPPLWGIEDTAPYFHDGRAETLLDAILMHEGEAEGVRQAFEALTPRQQRNVIHFLEDL